MLANISPFVWLPTDWKLSLSVNNAANLFRLQKIVILLHYNLSAIIFTLYVKKLNLSKHIKSLYVEVLLLYMVLL